MVLFALAAVGGSSASEGWLNSRGGLKPALPGLWIGGDDLLLYRDTLSNRQYALDTLALRYVGDYTRDPQAVEDTRGGYWCGTAVIEQSGKSPARERSETALRKRARAMVERHAPPGR